MKHNADNQNDFSALQQLLALKRSDIPADTEVNRFLIELHRHQRARLLQPAVNPWTYAFTWLGNKVELLTDSLNQAFGLSHLVKPFAYGSGFAALALVAVWGANFGTSDAPSLADASSPTFSLRSTTDVSAISSPADKLMASASLLSPATAPVSKLSRLTESFKFTSHPLTATIPQFVLVDSHAAYDVHAAF